MTQAAVPSSHEHREPAPVEPPEQHCPRCGSRDARRSHSRHLFDGIARTLGYKPYRCRACRHRFFANDEA